MRNLRGPLNSDPAFLGGALWSLTFRTRILRSFVFSRQPHLRVWSYRRKRASERRRFRRHGNPI